MRAINFFEDWFKDWSLHLIKANTNKWKNEKYFLKMIMKE